MGIGGINGSVLRGLGDMTHEGITQSLHGLVSCIDTLQKQSVTLVYLASHGVARFRTLGPDEHILREATK